MTGSSHVDGIGPRGENLIFLVSQPRAGSTMLQRMLACHPQIHTVAEPWLMLHPLYALRAEGHSAEYGSALAATATQGFLQQIAGGESAFDEGLRRMYTYLYNCALEGTGKAYFLDKTPRYYLVLPELQRVLPGARYIILLRNPLAVLISIIDTWARDNWLSLRGSFARDLNAAPALLCKAMDVLGDQCIILHYEDLLRDPHAEMTKLCQELSIDFEPGMVVYGSHDLPRWELGDQGSVYRSDHPLSANADKWVQALADPLVWRWARRYLRSLGRQTVERMGYPYDELLQTVAHNRPHRARMLLAYPRAWALTILSIEYSVRRRGIRGTLAALATRLAGATPS